MQLSVLKILLFSIIGLVGYYYVPQRYRKSFLALLSTIFYLQYSVKMYILALVCISGSWGLSFVIERAKGKCKNFLLNLMGGGGNSGNLDILQDPRILYARREWR